MDEGQVNAPVQLLLGVTILSFVLIIGFFTYERMSRNQYEQKVKASLSKLARNMELVFQGGQGTSKTVNVDFSPPSGANMNVESIRIIPGTKQTCKRNTGRDNCLELVVIQSQGPESKDILTIEVLDIPSVGMTVEKKGPKGEETCDVTGIESDDWSADWGSDELAKCAWLPSRYSVKITKKGPHSLLIE